MHKFKSSLLLAVILFSYTALAQSFEGKVTLAIEDEKSGETQSLDYFTDGTQGAFVVNQEGMDISLIMKKDTMFMVLHPMKMFVAIPFNGEGVKKEGIEEAEGSVVNTGETKVINGMNCTKYLIKTPDKDEAIAWFTKELGGFFLFNFDNNGEGPAGMFGNLKELSNQFPVLITEMKDGQEVVMLEVKSVEKMTVDKNLFEIPAGYKSMEQGMFEGQ